MNATTQAHATAGAPDPYASRPWLSSYPTQVPQTIDEARIGTLNDIFRKAVADYPNRAAVESFGKRMTYAALGREADAVASWLQGQGLQIGPDSNMSYRQEGGELARRLTGLPRVTGYVLAGVACGPHALDLVHAPMLAGTRVFVDLALGLIVFELGHRLDLEWLGRNRWLALAALGESLGAFFAIYAGLLYFDYPPLLAASAAAVGTATSPAVVMVVAHELRASGQITERMLLFTAAVEPRAPLSQGWLRASHRKLDPSRSRPYQPWHTHDELQPLEPGEVYRADVEIWPTCVVAPAGYRLGLTILGRDFDNGLDGPHPMIYQRAMTGSGPWWHTSPDDRPAGVFGGRTTVETAPDQPATLLVPIIPRSQP